MQLKEQSVPHGLQTASICLRQYSGFMRVSAFRAGGGDKSLNKMGVAQPPDKKQAHTYYRSNLGSPSHLCSISYTD